MRGTFKLVDDHSSMNSPEGCKNTNKKQSGIAETSDRDLLIYIGDLLLELEELAVASRFDGLADRLALAHREAGRARKGRC